MAGNINPIQSQGIILNTTNKVILLYPVSPIPFLGYDLINTGLKVKLSDQPAQLGTGKIAIKLFYKVIDLPIAT